MSDEFNSMLKCLKKRSALDTDDTNARFCSVTPFGSPVVPLVYMITKRSSQPEGDASASVAPVARSASMVTTSPAITDGS